MASNRDWEETIGKIAVLLKKFDLIIRAKQAGIDDDEIEAPQSIGECSELIEAVRKEIEADEFSGKAMILKKLEQQERFLVRLGNYLHESSADRPPDDDELRELLEWFENRDD